MKKNFFALFLSLFLSLLFAVGIAANADAAADKLPGVGPVKINAHPGSLEGKTVVLRWNGKPNGDKFLTRFGELLSQQVKGVKIVRMWEVDKSTAVITKTPEASRAVAEKIAAYRPAIVIASQAD